MKVLVLGVGNVLMKDEGIGVRAIEELQGRYDFPPEVELLDGGTSGMELLSCIDDRDLLIIIDAVKAGLAPGTVMRVEGEDVPVRFRTRISPHQLGLSDLLAAAAIAGGLPREMVLFGVEPAIVEFGLGLSPEVAVAMDRLVGVVVEEIRDRGLEVGQMAAPAGHKSFWAAPDIL